MAINISDLEPFAPVYSFVDNNGSNVHISSHHIYQYVRNMSPEIFLVPIDYSLVKTFLRDNAVSIARVSALARCQHLDPIIFARSEPLGSSDVLLVDGHHRYALAAITGRFYIRAHVLSYDEWQPFRVIGHPDLTRDQLRASPILPRNY